MDFAALERRADFPREDWYAGPSFEREGKGPFCLAGLSPVVSSGATCVHDIEQKLKGQVLDDGAGSREDKR